MFGDLLGKSLVLAERSEEKRTSSFGEFEGFVVQAAEVGAREREAALEICEENQEGVDREFPGAKSA